MTFHVRTPHMYRAYSALLLAAATILTACAPDGALGPDGSQPATLTLTASRLATLASFGDSIVLSPRVLDRDGQAVDGVRLRWSVSGDGVVQRDAEGVYRAIGNGRVTIVAEIDPGETGVRPAGYWADRLADSVRVEVRQQPVRLALVAVDTAFATLGARRQLRVQVVDARGNPTPDAPPPLTWLSADPGVVAVDSAGEVRSLGEGAARITVRGDGLSGTATFTVLPRLPHTSCMVFTRRRESQRSCVTLQFVVSERGGGR